jgi:hypothetical protein
MWEGVRVGDSVEVNFQGEWFKGTVKLIEDGGIAAVHCDVDPPDVMTKAPMNLLRRPLDSSAVPQPVSQATQSSPEVEDSAVPQSSPPSPEGAIKKPHSHRRQASA